MDIAQLINQHPHFYANDALAYKKCRHCINVTKRDLSGASYLCPVCNFYHDYPDSFFDLNTLLMIDTMEESFARGHLEHSPLITPSRTQNASVVVFFCTIKEVLLHRFLDHFLRELNLPPSFIADWDKHYPTHSQRLRRLFKSLTGKNWNEAIAQLPAGTNDFSSVDNFLVAATRARNSLLHEGENNDIGEDIAQECFINLAATLELFVSLHNKYVHPLRHNTVVPNHQVTRAG